MRKNIEKIGKNAEISHNHYLRERAILMQDIKKMTIEYDLISKQYTREQKTGQIMWDKLLDVPRISTFFNFEHGSIRIKFTTPQSHAPSS